MQTEDKVEICVLDGQTEIRPTDSMSNGSLCQSVMVTEKVNVTLMKMET